MALPRGAHEEFTLNTLDELKVVACRRDLGLERVDVAAVWEVDLVEVPASQARGATCRDVSCTNTKKMNAKASGSAPARRRPEGGAAALVHWEAVVSAARTAHGWQ